MNKGQEWNSPEFQVVFLSKRDNIYQDLFVYIKIYLDIVIKIYLYTSRLIYIYMYQDLFIIKLYIKFHMSVLFTSRSIYIEIVTG